MAQRFTANWRDTAGRAWTNSDCGEALEALDINVWKADVTVTVEQCDDPGLSDADLLVGDGQDHHFQSNCTVRDVAVSRVLEGLVWGTVDHLAQVTSLDVSNLLVVE